ncbi:hypothetical protein SLEP1_g26840 [Rubroshorea leprosula]|uniref:Uncharacterized protein n=1 Tax=Rubroshorea leprosula TaxID=152421 RepID=A0AAV5JY38_9ROSI|nr:hypothetical protein SLEP1_g26840 [Rubroshorea leprosula]
MHLRTVGFDLCSFSSLESWFRVVRRCRGDHPASTTVSSIRPDAFPMSRQAQITPASSPELSASKKKTRCI